MPGQNLTPTPRNRLLGMLADATRGVSDAAGQYPQGALYADLVHAAPGALGIDDLSTVLDRASYGERQTKGSGQTLQMRDELPGALGALIPGAQAVTRIGPKVAQAGVRAAAAGARNLALPSDMAMQGQRGVVADPLAMFGRKAEREAALQKKVLSSTDEPQQSTQVRAAGPRGKIDADVYRNMENAGQTNEMLALFRRNGHLKPDGAGGYIGAPRTVDSPQALGAMRRNLDEQFSGGVDAIAHADPDRLGTWYDRAKDGISVSSEPHQVPRVLDQHAVYSAGVAPESELGFALKHLNSRAVGEPAMAYRGAPMRALDSAEAAGEPTQLGFKTGEYRNKNDPSLPNTGNFGVNDFRAAQGFGYTTPDGAIWKGGVSDTMHPFMDAETALTGDRANAAAVGGRTDWQGPHIQEIPWVLGKAEDIYGRGMHGRFAGEQGREQAIREANNTAQDYMHKHAAAATYEYTPGKSTGHVPSVLEAPSSERAAYGERGRWDSARNARGDPIDEIYSALGFRQLPSAPTAGAHVNSTGALETNPAMMARPLADFPTGGVGDISQPTQNVMSAAERFRATMDAQEAGAYNLPNTMSTVKDKTGLVLDSRAYAPRGADPALGLQPNEQQMGNLAGMLQDTGYVPSATSRGVSVLPVGDNPMPINRLRDQLAPWMEAEFPSTASQARMSTGYVPGIGRWGPNGIEATEPFSGQATSGLLDAFAQLKGSVTQNLGESEGVRSAIRAKIGRDEAMPGARRDIQNTRNFFAEADWPAAVEMIRKGMTPAAALAAMGYSVNSMAGESR